ncbi:MAG: DUF2163 domain-containing protein, partial [Pseudomonadota bacterium]
TDHDRALSFDGLAFRPETAIDAAALERGLGLAIDNLEISGALSSRAIRDVDIERGLYDGAEIALWRVDWSAPALRVLLFRGRIGEIRRLSGPDLDGPQDRGAFFAEIQGLSERLNRPTGRVIAPTCDARLGDARCGVDLAALAVAATVAAIETSDAILISGPDPATAARYTRGALAWTSGGNAPDRAAIKRCARINDAVRLSLWAPPAAPIAVGDALSLSPGCDKLWTTCRDVYANTARFRGFPHVPSDDWVTTYPARGGRHDGASMNR